jgi:CHAD domain-containing protein
MAPKVKSAARGGPESVAAVRDLVLAHVDAVISRLELRRAMTSIDVHEARKSIKRARAVLKLLRPSLPARDAARSRRELRDAGRALAPARDAKVVADRFDEMLRRTGIAKSAVNRLAGNLPTAAAAQPGDPVTVLIELAAARKRLARASLPARNWTPLGAGIRSIYRSGRQLVPGKPDTASVEAMHEWRKQVKSYWHALEVLAPVCPTQIRHTIGLARRLADSLGEEHDLALLADHLRIAAAVKRDEPVTELFDAIERRRRRLRRRALKIGTALYSEAPVVMENQLRRYWQQWRSERALEG